MTPRRTRQTFSPRKTASNSILKPGMQAFWFEVKIRTMPPREWARRRAELWKRLCIGKLGIKKNLIFYDGLKRKIRPADFHRTYTVFALRPSFCPINLWSLWISESLSMTCPSTSSLFSTQVRTDIPLSQVRNVVVLWKTESFPVPMFSQPCCTL